MGKTKKQKRLKAYLIKWFDIESNAGWGDMGDAPPIAIEIRFLHRRPDKRHPIPCWLFKSGMMEHDPSDMTRIPAVNMIEMVEVHEPYPGAYVVPFRDRGE